jgi:hypothetical protein
MHLLPPQIHLYPLQAHFSRFKSIMSFYISKGMMALLGLEALYFVSSNLSIVNKN